ncbi:thioredoxin-like protein [Fistulina hepatica ATCC 64428]|uniref:Thioredoxin-like protein n=1 Tax=Fistulina hepatica ATCC 64428 TaxID=1128425 RepID=A0A0D7ABG3_9AGAR|nr:thioredoxin-like protein [Fistulina hepatica ATCC 64428]
MAINADEDTEFNDALRKHGILPPLPLPPRSPSPPPKKTLAEEAEELTADELRRLTEDADEETERILEHVKRTRLREEQRERELGRFGRVYPIGRDDYTREVTEASIVGDDAAIRASGNGTGVVCFLYKDEIPASDRTFQQIHILAARHPRTKFVSIVGDKCIPNLPDARIPMIIVYRKGDIKQQIVGWARDKERRIEGIFFSSSLVSYLADRLARTGSVLDSFRSHHPVVYTSKQ